MDKEHFYDQIISVIINNLQLSAEDHTIKLANFNSKNKSHLCIFYAARICHDIFNMKLQVNMTYFQWVYFCHKFKCKKYVTRCGLIGAIDCVELTSLIEKANNIPNLLADIYTTFYEDKK